ncbi:hypothetical protein L1049_008566 [Liquidambar formosana]|uniref:Uncharacterized protein n=1 Tax=Liquidambar formosana TaxID=63359 RepID=A0AAP0S4H4_LIQFO
MIDVARLLAQRGVTVTIITTSINATRFNKIVHRGAESGLRIQLFQIPFPSIEAGLPEGCESMDTLPSRNLLKNLLIGIGMLQPPIEKLFNPLKPAPSCIISDENLKWTEDTTRKFQIPRTAFDGTSCFLLLCTHNLHMSKVYESVSELEPFVVPGLPDRIELTIAQLPGAINIGSTDLKDIRNEIRAAELAAYGVVVNTFQELEPAYVKEFRKVRGEKVWCIGPVSLCNKEDLGKAERGNKASTDETQCLKWLDSWEPSSVVYACLGSLSHLTPPQLIELGLGMEASNRSFIWVIREGNQSEELKKWTSEEGFEDRINGPERPFDLGLGTTSVPMITWTLFAELFYNEKFIVQVLRIGVRVGAEFAVKWGEEEKFGVLRKREEVKQAIDQLMDAGEEGQERRNRASELREMANKALEGGGSSYINMALLIQDIMQQVIGNPLQRLAIPTCHQHD